jgi:hypothetical protein
MRTRLWNNLANIKFKALYTCECSRLAGKLSRIISFMLAFVSASGVATWALWRQHTTIWAMTIGIAQVLQIAVPHIPFLKSEKDFLSMSFEFEQLYLKYENLWDANEDETHSQTTIKKQFRSLREKEVEIEKTHKDVRCPEVKRWILRINKKAVATLELDFS